MPTELDHVFICSSRDAADSLIAFGLTEGTPNVHQGQGTACRRFFFHNAYLELLWVSDASEAQSEATRPTFLWDRWKGKDEGTCPFGLGFGQDQTAMKATFCHVGISARLFAGTAKYSSVYELRSIDRTVSVLSALCPAMGAHRKFRSPVKHFREPT